MPPLPAYPRFSGQTSPTEAILLSIAYACGYHLLSLKSTNYCQISGDVQHIIGQCSTLTHHSTLIHYRSTLANPFSHCCQNHPAQQRREYKYKERRMIWFFSLMGDTTTLTNFAYEVKVLTKRCQKLTTFGEAWRMQADLIVLPRTVIVLADTVISLLSLRQRQSLASLVERQTIGFQGYLHRVAYCSPQTVRKFNDTTIRSDNGCMGLLKRGAFQRRYKDELSKVKNPQQSSIRSH